MSGLSVFLRNQYFSRFRILFFYRERKIRKNLIEILRICLNPGGEIAIPFLDLDITTLCNLRCRKCAKCIPYFSKKRNVPYEEFRRELDSLLKYVDKIYVASIIGGEPFLNPDLPEIIRLCSKCSKIENLEMTTNATVMPSGELFAAMKKSRVMVQISNYPDIDEEKKKIRQTVIRKLEEYGIPHEFPSHEHWLDLGDASRKQHTDRENRMLYRSCKMNSCTVYNSGVLYRCGRESYLEQNGFDVQRNSIRVDEIHSREQMRRAMREFFGAAFLDSCDYCELHPQLVTPGEQIEGKI